MLLRRGFVLLGRGVHICEKDRVHIYFKYIILSSHYSGVHAFGKRVNIFGKGVHVYENN